MEMGMEDGALSTYFSDAREGMEEMETLEQERKGRQT